jgi:phosphohistidine phosphatase
MLLYLVQHGEAKREEEDPQRGLTDKGTQDVGAVAVYARRMHARPERIFHSAKLRARQTAEILAGLLEPRGGMDQAGDLLPLDDPALWAARLAGMHEDAMLVGHLPFMARIAGLLLCGDKERACVDFTMGGIVCLRRSEDGTWAVAWMVVPEMARLLSVP